MYVRFHNCLVAALQPFWKKKKDIYFGVDRLGIGFQPCLCTEAY